MQYEIEMLERRLNMEVEQVDRSLDWQNRQLSLALDYMERLNRGLVKNGGYVEIPSMASTCTSWKRETGFEME